MIIQLLSLSIVTFITSAISAIAGMGGGVILLSIMISFMPTQIIIPIHGMVQLISNSYRCWLLRVSIKKDFLLYFALGIPFGLIPSITLIKNSVQNPHIFQFTIATIILFVLFKPKSKFKSVKKLGMYFFNSMY